MPVLASSAVWKFCCQACANSRKAYADLTETADG